MPYLASRGKMSEDHFDQYEHFNYDQDKQMLSGHSGQHSLVLVLQLQ